MNSIDVVDFKSVFETLPGLYLILNPGFTIVAVSDAYLKATMTDREAIIGHGLFEIFPDNPDEKEATGVSKLRASLNAVLELGQPHKMAEQKYDIRKPDGVFEERYWSPLNSPVFNEAHKLVYIIHNVIDITDQQRASKKLKKSEKDYQLLISSVKDYAIFMVDTDGLVASWNSGAESIKGYTADEIIGKPISFFYTRGDIEKGVPQNNLQKAIQYGHFEAEGWRLKKDGNLFWANIVITPLKDEEGMLYGYSKISRDITEKKRLREQINHLGNIVEQSSEAIISRGIIDQRFISWNRGAEILLGYRKEEAIGKKPEEMGISRFTGEEIEGMEKEVFEKGSWKSEKEFYHKNGSSFFGAVTANAIKNEEGEITSMVFIIKDISLRKQLEDQLKKYNTALEQEVKVRTEEVVKSESRFRALIENSNDLILLMDESFTIYYRSPSAFRITGWKDEELINADGTKNIHPDDINKTKDIVRKLMADPGKPINCLIRILHKDGHYLWMEGVVINLLDDEYVKALMLNFRDVTSRVEGEAKLAASEERFRLLIENSTDGIDLIDEFSNRIYRSPGAIKITGPLPKENQISLAHPDDLETISNKQKEAQTNPGKSIPFLTRFRHAQGHYIWVEGTITNLLHVDGVHAIVANFRDVSSRIEAEAELAASEMRFRLLIENSADGIDLSDEFSNNIYRSPGAIKITGILSKDNQRSLTHPDDLEIIKNKSEELIEKPGIPIAFQARFRHALGHYIWLEGTLTNLLHVEGVKAIVTNFRDVTERKKLEDLLRKANTLARIGSWEVDLLKGAVYWNDITREIHEAESGFVPDLATGINFYKEGPGRDLITQKVNDAIERGKPWDVELQIITAKNNERWVRSIGETEFADDKCARIYGSFQDIDKRKKVEEALLRSEARARRIFESDMIGFVFWSEKGQILEANDYFLNMTGYTRQDLEKGLVNWAAMTPPEYAYLDIISLKQLETTGICKPFEKEYIRKDGSRLPIMLGAAALGENFDGVGVCYVMDITERKKAEIDRERLNERLQLATQSAQLGLWDWDVKNNRLIWDEAMYRLYNLTENEFTTVYDGWASRVHEEDKQRVDNDIQLALAGKKEYNPEFRIVWPDSSVHYINASGIVERDHDGNAVRMTGFNWDVTERKKAEEKIKSSEEHYRMLVEQSADGIFLSDANGRYVDANPSGCKMLGYTWEEIVTMSLPDVLTEAEVKRLPEAIANFEGGSITSSEWVFKRKDGSAFIGEVIGRALPDGRLQGILRDITERKAAEEKIKNINIELEEKVISRTEQLRRTNEELEAFSYSVSHDLRAPLRGIIGFTNILEEEYTSQLDDEAKRITGVIKTNTMKMGHLIDDLLAFSRMGRQELIKAPVDTNTMVQEIMDQLKATSKNPDLQWIIEPLPVINADIGTIRQVWINLVSNAIKYSSNTKHPQITIGHYVEGWQQVFFVKDNGVGFSNEYRDKLFRVFQRLHSAEEFEGTGVGLALVGKIIFKHGGKVWAEAEVNKGASFYFSLPIV